jgi:hypothetical protein
MPFDVRSAISPLAIVVLPEPLVGAAIRNAGFISAKVHTFCIILHEIRIFFTLIFYLFTFLCTFAAENEAIWWPMPPDVRESSESLELYLQL